MLSKLFVFTKLFYNHYIFFFFSNHYFLPLFCVSFPKTASPNKNVIRVPSIQDVMSKPSAGVSSYLAPSPTQSTTTSSWNSLSTKSNGHGSGTAFVSSSSSSRSESQFSTVGGGAKKPGWFTLLPKKNPLSSSLSDQANQAVKESPSHDSNTSASFSFTSNTIATTTTSSSLSDNSGTTTSTSSSIYYPPPVDPPLPLDPYTLGLFTCCAISTTKGKNAIPRGTFLLTRFSGNFLRLLYNDREGRDRRRPVICESIFSHSCSFLLANCYALFLFAKLFTNICYSCLQLFTLLFVLLS